MTTFTLHGFGDSGLGRVHSKDTAFMFWTKSRFTVFFTIGAATTLKTPMILSTNVPPRSSLFSTASGSTLLSDPWFNIAKKIKDFLSV